MKNVLHNKNRNRNAVQVQVEPPPIPLIKSKNNEILDKYCVNIKLRRDPKSQKSDPIEFKIYLFDSSDLENFLVFNS